MNNIQILLKPDDISYECICEVIIKAHSTLEKDGVGKLSTSNISAKELNEKLGDDGFCVVAMNNDKLIGCGCVSTVNINTWFFRGNALMYCLLAILPENRGQGIAKGILAKKLEILKERKVKFVIGKIRECNKKSIMVSLSVGFKPVQYYIGFGNHPSVLVTYWLNGCPYSNLYVDMRFKFSKIETKLKRAAKKILRRK